MTPPDPFKAGYVRRLVNAELDALLPHLAATLLDGAKGVVRRLVWLAGELGYELLDRLVVTTGSEAYRRPDGIAVVPLALLGP